MIKDKKNYKILIIEDNPGDYIIVEDLLMEQITAPNLIHASNFKQAAQLLSDEGDPFDVVLLDLTLPDKSGQTLITEILNLASASPVIILTGFTDIDFSIRSISLGIADYLLKDELNSNILYKSILYARGRKQMTAELKESEKRYSNLFNLSPQPMWLFESESLRFLQVNNAATTLYGYTEDEFLNMTVLDLKLEEDKASTIEIVNNIPEDEPSVRQLVKHVKKSGELIDVETYSTPILLKDYACRSVIAIDVTQENLYEQKIIKAIIKTQEDERYEIGGELHDNVCQLLATSQLSLGMLKDSLDEQTLKWYDKCREYIMMAAEEIRNLSHRLAPAFFDDSTLQEAFKILLHSFNVGDRYHIILNVEEKVKKSVIPLDLQLNLYRILQEQLKNILKYSKAGLIEVDVKIHNNKLKMMVCDDGIGFDMTAVKGGIGLANMKRRAELFSGKSYIKSSPGEGCTITIEIPINGVS